MVDNSLIPLKDSTYRKSNELITSKYASTLIENQIIAVALTRVENNYKDKDYPLEAKLYPGELKEFISDDTHIYDVMKKVVKRLVGHTLFMENGNGDCMAIAMIPKADYSNSILTVKFAPELRSHIIGLSSGYTPYQLATVTSFKTNAAFRLYEVLKSYTYLIKDNDVGYTVEYRLSELRFMLGTANIDDKAVRDYIESKGTDIDWDYALSLCPAKYIQHAEYKKFNQRILKVAQNELKKVADIRFEYKGVREKKETKRIRFTIFRNTPTETKKIDKKAEYIKRVNKSERQMELPLDMFPDLYNDLVGKGGIVTEGDVTLFLEKAGYDERKVRRAIEFADKQGPMANYIGWVMKCIEIGFDEKTVVEGEYKEISDPVVSQLYDKYKSVFKKESDIDVIFNAANKDVELTEYIIRMAIWQSQYNPIRNIVGWCKKAIENDYDWTPIIDGSNQKAEIKYSLKNEIAKQFTPKKSEELSKKLFDKKKESPDFEQFKDKLEKVTNKSLEECEQDYTYESLFQAWIECCVHFSTKGTINKRHLVLKTYAKLSGTRNNLPPTKPKKMTLTERAWRACQEKENYKDFVDIIESNGMTIKELELIFGFKKLKDSYIAFVKGEDFEDILSE